MWPPNCKVSKRLLLLILLAVGFSQCKCSSLEVEGVNSKQNDASVPSAEEILQLESYFPDLLAAESRSAPVSVAPPPTGASSTMLSSDEDPINHSLEYDRYPMSTENSVGVTRPSISEYNSPAQPQAQSTGTNSVYSNAPQSSSAGQSYGPSSSDNGQKPYNSYTYSGSSPEAASHPVPAYQSYGTDLTASDGSISTTTQSTLTGDPGQLPTQMPIQRYGSVYPDDGYPVTGPTMNSAAASDRILVRHSVTKRTKLKLPVYTTVFSHHQIIPDGPPRKRYKRRPRTRRGKPRPKRRGRGRPRRPHSRGGPPLQQQPYGLGSMQLPTYAPAFVSYGPIFGPPPGIQIKQPVQTQAFGLPTQQSMAYIPVVHHGPNGVISPPQNYGFPPQGQYMQPHPQAMQSGHSMPPPYQGNPMPLQGPNSYRQPALTISVEAPSNMYASPPRNPDGSPVNGPKPPGMYGPPPQNSALPPAGPHPVPGYSAVAVPVNAVPLGPPRPGGPPGPVAGPMPPSGPSYMSPIPVPSSAPMRYMPSPGYRSQPSNSYPSNYQQATNHYGQLAPQNSAYNPPMHFGPPMHNYGPPHSSFGQPPPIMGEPHIDKWAPPTGYHTYPGGAGYSSQENSVNTGDRYRSSGSNYQSGRNNYYGKQKGFNDFRASQEDHFGHSDEHSPQYSGPSSNQYRGSSSSGSNYNRAPTEPNNYSDPPSSSSSYDNPPPSTVLSEYHSDPHTVYKRRRKQRKPNYDDGPTWDSVPGPPYTPPPSNTFPSDDFFSDANFQDPPSSSPISDPPRRKSWRRRRTGGPSSGYYRNGNYESNMYPNDRKGEEYTYSKDSNANSVSSYEDGSKPVRNRKAGKGSGALSDYTTSSPSRADYDSSSRGYDSDNPRPVPKYDTKYNSPGMSKDPKVTDWFDYAERTPTEKLKLGYPRRYKKKVTRYRTLPDSIDSYAPDPNHKKYPKLTYDTLKSRRGVGAEDSDKMPKFLSEESKLTVFKTGPEFKKMLNAHDTMMRV